MNKRNPKLKKIYILFQCGTFFSYRYVTLAEAPKSRGTDAATIPLVVKVQYSAARFGWALHYTLSELFICL
jgi:hypothetical protein